MSTSPEQLAANRANAQHSTGPTSDPGKAASSQNALRHGLTGNTVVLPTEDKNEFQRFCTEILACLKPENALEREFAQIVANSQWRLKRVKSIEDGMLGLTGDADSEGLAQAFMGNSRLFANLGHYENRLYRTMTNALKQLKELQAARKSQAEAIETRAYALFNDWKYSTGNLSANPPTEVHATIPAPPANGFVFSTPEIAPLGPGEFAIRPEFTEAKIQNRIPGFSIR